MISTVWAMTLSATAALAGGGPWTLSPGARNLYVGTTNSRYSQIAGDQGTTEVGTVQSTTLQAIGTVGLMDGVEVELQLPWTRANHLDPSAAPCVAAGDDADLCRSSASLAPLQLTLKGSLLSERALQPVSLSAALSLRAGNPTAQYRDRLTSTGDGQTDVGAGVSLGRTGELGTHGWYRLAASGSYWYRTALASPDGQKVPSDQVELGLGGLVAPVRAVGIGPLVTGFHRLGGVELSQLRPDDPNGFQSLASSQVKAGLELSLFGEEELSLSVSALQTVWAQNNPVDTRQLSVGLGWYRAPSGG